MKNQRHGMRTGLALVLAAGALGCSAKSEEPDTGALRGELRIYRISYEDGRREREFYLSPDAHSAEVSKLVFERDPELSPWTRLKVWGTADGEQILVSRYEIDVDAEALPGSDAVRAREQALVSGPKRTRTAGFVLIDTGSGVNITKASAETAVFGTRGSDAALAQYYSESSYGTLTFSGEVLGPTMVSDLGNCDTASVVRIENRWAQTFGKQFDHWMSYLGARFSACGWGGIGGEGTAARPAYGSWYNASTGCVVLSQEVGHNLGLNHAGTMDCGTSILLDTPLSGCTGSEYGSQYTPMGSRCMHMNAYEKWYEGFFGGCNGVKARSSGSYTLLPMELTCDGVQALQIPMPKQRTFRNTTGTRDVTIGYYYLELRTRRGLDDKGTSGSVTGPTVLVHVVGDVPQPSIVSTFSWLLDMDPNTTKFDGMTLAQTFTDPAGGVSFTVQTLDNDRATINVNVAAGSGAPTCMDGTTFAPPGPASCGSGSGGSGGGGTGGSAGTGGTSGAAGSAGAAGTGGAGAGGVAGSGTGGSGATSGSGGVAGSGTAGVGNAAGSNGASGNTGRGGASTAGASGSARSTPASESDVDGSCACQTAPPRTAASWGALTLLLSALLQRRRKR